MSGPIAVLVGAPGSGKTTVGRCVAEELGVTFHDTDQAIEAAAGKSVADIFITDGEPEFRRLERLAVASALNEQTGVVALGGGAILDPKTRQLLAGHAVVWLQVGAADATRRVGMTGARPLLLGNVRGMLVTMLDERTPLYAQVATHTVPTDGRDVAQVCADVVAALLGEARP